MSERQFFAYCGHDRCPNALRVFAESEAAARLLIHREHGWGGDGDVDLCPTHTPRSEQ